MSTFEAAYPVVFADEGGLSNNPADPGGLTKFGVSHKAFPNVDIASLTLEEAKQILQTNYWRFDGVTTQAIATKLLDMSVNLGLDRAVQVLQQALNDLGATLSTDGHWGPQTLASCNSLDQTAVHRELQTHQQSYYVSLVAQNPSLFPFLKGWLRRANAV
jgi:lysozyme family protein